MSKQISYIIFRFVFTLALCVLFSYRKKWLRYLLHAIKSLLTWKVDKLNKCILFEVLLWFYPEYWIYYYSLRIELFQLFVFVNNVLCFFLCNFTSHGICIEQIYYLTNLYFFVACVGHPKSVVTWYLETLLDFRNY